MRYVIVWLELGKERRWRVKREDKGYTGVGNAGNVHVRIGACVGARLSPACTDAVWKLEVYLEDGKLDVSHCMIFTDRMCE